MYEDDAERTRFTFEPAYRVAWRLGVPESWLLAEAKAGRVPALRAGKSLLFNFDAVERSLIARLARAALAPGPAAT